MSKKKTAYLINLLWSMIELNNEPKLNQKALDYLLKDIEFFYNQPEVRPLVFQIIGCSDKLDKCIAMFEPFGILEMVRTGKVVITRGKEET